jgi:hypothetical protein
MGGRGREGEAWDNLAWMDRHGRTDKVLIELLLSLLASFALSCVC